MWEVRSRAITQIKPQLEFIKKFDFKVSKMHSPSPINMPMKFHSSRTTFLPALLVFSLALFASVDGAKAWIAPNATSNYTVVIGNGSQSTVTFQWTHMGNGTARIDGFNGNGTFIAATPLIPHPDIDTRPIPSECDTCGLTSDRTWNKTTHPTLAPLKGGGLSPGYLFFDTDTNTIWEFVDYLRDPANVITDWQWKVHNTGDARLGEDIKVSLGTIVREQDDTGVVYYQKIAMPGTSATDWMKVNFEIPKYVEVGFTMNASVAGRGNPSTINTNLPLSSSNYTVTSIAANAFKTNTDLKSVALPSTLTSIGNSTFELCKELGAFNDERGVFIPAGVTYIGPKAFGKCKELRSIIVHELNPVYSWYEGVLYNKDRTELVQYPTSKLGMVYEVPATINKILANAVEGNTYLVRVEIPDAVYFIGKEAFKDINSLVTVEIGKGFGATNGKNGTIGDGAFEGCVALGSAVFNGEAPINKGTNIFNLADDDFNIQYFDGYNFPATWDNYTLTKVSTVGDFTFSANSTSGMATITGYKGTGGVVEIPETFGTMGVRYIGDSAFAGKVGITSVTMKSGIFSIGNSTFAGVTTLANVTFGSGLSSIGKSAFQDCDELTSVTIPASVTLIDAGAFSSCGKLTAINVDLGNSKYLSSAGVVYSKDQSSLYHYPAGKTGSMYEIQDSVTTVADRAFEGNVYISQLEFPKSVTTIGNRTCYDSRALADVRFGTKVNSIGEEAFAGIVSPLISATFYGDAPGNFTMTGDGVFGGALNEFKVYCLRKSMTSFGFGVNATTSIWNTYDATLLEQVDDFKFTIIPNNTVQIDKYTGRDPQIIADIKINEDTFPVNYVYDDIFSDEWDVNFSPLFSIPANSYVLNRRTGLIYRVQESSGIRSWVLVTYLDLPSTTPVGTTVEEQGVNATVRQKVKNTNLDSSDWIIVDFEVPEKIVGLNVSSINATAFAENTVISSVVLPTTLTNIGDGAFRNCDRLTAVFIPASVSTCGNGTFAYCDKLERIYVDPANPVFTASNSDINYGVLFDKNKTKVVQYPPGRLASYYATPNTVRTIQREAFAGNMYLNTLKVSDACKTIESSSFNGSQSLTKVDMGIGVGTIYEGAFANISALSQVLFNGNVPDFSLTMSQNKTAELFFTNAKVRYLPGAEGWDEVGWLSPTPIPSWYSGIYKTTGGFRAVGTIEPAAFNNNIGGQIEINVNRNGISTGTIKIGGATGTIENYRFIKGFDSEGKLDVTVYRRSGLDLKLSLQLDISEAPSRFLFPADGNNTITVAGETADISANSVSWNTKNPATTYQGYYTVGLETAPADLIPKIDTEFGLQQPEVSQGHGFLALNVAAATGAMRFSGVLADGTKVTGASVVTAPSVGDNDPKCVVPMFIPLYASKGTLLGDMSISANKTAGNPLTADLSWSKPAGIPKSPNASGFDDVSLTAIAGSGAFTAPATTNFNPITLKFSASNWLGDFASLIDFNQEFEVNRGRISPKSPNDNGVKATWNLRTGLFQGTFKDSQSLLGRFQGVMLNNGAGLKLRGNFQLPNTATSPTYYLGGTVEN